MSLRDTHLKSDVYRSILSSESYGVSFYKEGIVMVSVCLPDWLHRMALH